MEDLYDTLKKYSKTDAYPFHMPGHKRHLGNMVNPYSIDITEIEGFDDLHHAEGILKELEEKAAQLYKTEETHLLINGSTAGILSAVSGCTSRHGKIAVARNCHKSVYHGVLLNELQLCYLYPQYLEKYGINGGIFPEDVDNLLKKEPDIQAVIITSPTYEGVVSDVEAIAKVVHKYHLPLIVDEAHGAHFYFHDKFPKGALECGADVVINSLHKTLPAFTQTALLHMQGAYVNREKIRKYLSIYQTSSPSYILMSGIGQCLGFMEQQGKAQLEKLWGYLKEFYQLAEKLQKISIVNEQIKEYSSVYDFDLSKIVICCKDIDKTGENLKDILREKYHLELEMSAGNYCLAMTTLADTPQGLERLMRAITEQEQFCDKVQEAFGIPYTCPKTEAVYTLAEAEDKGKENVFLEQAQGRVSAEMVYLYPPGIPILCPGEIITQEILILMKAYRKKGIHFRGMQDETGEYIQVIEER